MVKKFVETRGYYIESMGVTIYHIGRKYRQFNGWNYDEYSDKSIGKENYISLFNKYADETLEYFEVVSSHDEDGGTIFEIRDPRSPENTHSMFLNRDTCDLRFIVKEKANE